MNWYYALNGSQQGPVPEHELAQLAAAGTISSSTLVWREGLADWQPLSVVLPAALTSAAASAPQIGGLAVPEGQKDIVVQQMREGVMPSIAGAMDYAGFWIRVGAKFIDGLIIMIPMMILMFGFLALTGGFMAAAEGKQDDPTAAFAAIAGSIGINLAVYVVIVLYNGLLVSKYGATWGKMAVGIKVVSDDGSPIPTGRAWGRAFADLINQFCSLLYLMPAFDSEKRALHDHICSTRVIRVR